MSALPEQHAGSLALHREAERLMGLGDMTRAQHPLAAGGYYRAASALEGAALSTLVQRYPLGCERPRTKRVLMESEVALANKAQECEVRAAAGGGTGEEE